MSLYIHNRTSLSHFCELGYTLIPLPRNYERNGYKISAQRFLGKFGGTSDGIQANH